MEPVLDGAHAAQIPGGSDDRLALGPRPDVAGQRHLAVGADHHVDAPSGTLGPTLERLPTVTLIVSSVPSRR